MTTGKPQRVQRKRTKGWRMPPDTVYVGRGSRWGNPYKVGAIDRRTGATLDAATAVERFTDSIVRSQCFSEADVVRALRGKDLACWCRLDQACHADILLEIANEPQP